MTNSTRTYASYLVASILGVALLILPQRALADDPKDTIPSQYQGTWLFRLYSDDAGKSYKSGGNKPICEVSAKEVKFTEKVAFSDEKLKVKSVTKKDEAGQTVHWVAFDNGKSWKVYDLSGSITAIIHDGEGDKAKETYRITVRKAGK